MSDLCSGRRRTDWTCLQPVACFKHALLSSQVHDTVHCVPTMTTAPTMSMLSLARSTVVFICRAIHPRHSKRAQADPTILVQGHLLAMEIDANAFRLRQDQECAAITCAPLAKLLAGIATPPATVASR